MMQVIRLQAGAETAHLLILERGKPRLEASATEEPSMKMNDGGAERPRRRVLRRVLRLGSASRADALGPRTLGSATFRVIDLLSLVELVVGGSGGGSGEVEPAGTALEGLVEHHRGTAAISVSVAANRLCGT